MLFCEALGALRLKIGVQPAKLAAATGITPGRYKDIERGLVDPSLTEVLALCYVLKTTPEDLHYNHKRSGKANFSNDEESKPANVQENHGNVATEHGGKSNVENTEKENKTSNMEPKTEESQAKQRVYTQEELMKKRRELGKKIRAVRESKNITYAMASRVLGIPSYQLVLIEEGQADIPENLKDKLISLLQGEGNKT